MTRKSWQHLHSHSTHFDADDADGADGAAVEDAIPVIEEVFCATYRYNDETDYEGDPFILLQSKGFHGDTKELFWQQEHAFGEESSLVCTVQV